MWKQPSQCLYMQDDFIHEYIPQVLLVEALNLHYLHPSVIHSLNSSLRSQLGIKSLSVDHLKEVARVLLCYFHNVKNEEGEEREDVIVISDSEDEDDYHSSKEPMDFQSQRCKEESSRDLMVGWIARWLACVHIVVEESSALARTDLLDKIKDLRILPLEDGSFVSADEGSTIFFPPDNFKGMSKRVNVYKL